MQKGFHTGELEDKERICARKRYVAKEFRYKEDGKEKYIVCERKPLHGKQKSSI